MIGSLLAASLALGWLAYGRLDPSSASRRAFRRAVHKKIADVKNGELVKIAGRIEAVDRALRSPLGAHRCAYYETVIGFVMEELRHPQHADPSVLVRERYARELYVEDDTGKALIEVGTARIVVARESHRRGELTHAPSARVRSYLERHGYDASAFQGRTLLCEERILEPGDEIWVFGAARWERDPHPSRHGTAGYRDVPKRLVLGAPPDGVLVLTDDVDAL